MCPKFPNPQENPNNGGVKIMGHFPMVHSSKTRIVTIKKRKFAVGALILLLMCHFFTLFPKYRRKLVLIQYYYVFPSACECILDFVFGIKWIKYSGTKTMVFHK